MDVQYKFPKKDTYKNKIVVYGSLSDKEQKPLADAEVYLGNDKLLTKTDKHGDYLAFVDKQEKAKGLTKPKKSSIFYVWWFGRGRKCY